MDIILFQNRQEVRHLRNTSAELLNHLQKIAWYPYAVDGLIKYNIPFNTISDYQTQRVNIKDIESDANKLYDWATLLDKYIRKHSKEISDLKIRPSISETIGILIVSFKLVKTSQLVWLHLI